MVCNWFSIAAPVIQVHRNLQRLTKNVNGGCRCCCCIRVLACFKNNCARWLSSGIIRVAAVNAVLSGPALNFGGEMTSLFLAMSRLKLVCAAGSC